MDFENFKKIIEHDKDAKFIFIEDGKPSFVIISFEKYLSLISNGNKMVLQDTQQSKNLDIIRKGFFGNNNYDLSQKLNKELDLLKDDSESNKEIVDIEHFSI